MATNANASENFESNFLAYPVQFLELRRIHSAFGAVARTTRPIIIKYVTLGCGKWKRRDDNQGADN